MDLTVPRTDHGNKDGLYLCGCKALCKEELTQLSSQSKWYWHRSKKDLAHKHIWQCQNKVGYQIRIVRSIHSSSYTTMLKTSTPNPHPHPQWFQEPRQSSKSQNQVNDSFLMKQTKYFAYFHQRQLSMDGTNYMRLIMPTYSQIQRRETQAYIPYILLTRLACLYKHGATK